MATPALQRARRSTKAIMRDLLETICDLHEIREKDRPQVNMLASGCSFTLFFDEEIKLQGSEVQSAITSAAAERSDLRILTSSGPYWSGIYDCGEFKDGSPYTRDGIMLRIEARQRQHLPAMVLEENAPDYLKAVDQALPALRNGLGSVRRPIAYRETLGSMEMIIYQADIRTSAPPRQFIAGLHTIGVQASREVGRCEMAAFFPRRYVFRADRIQPLATIYTLKSAIAVSEGKK